MRMLYTVTILSLCGAVALGCGRNKDLDKKMKEAKEQQAAKKKADKEAEEAKKAARVKELAKEAAIREAAHKKRLAEMPKGNSAKTDEVAKTDEEKALIEELHKGNVDEKLAKKHKNDIEKIKPLLLRAVRHENSNVRVQSLRILIRRKAFGPDVVEAWAGAMKDEQNTIVLGQWGVDIRNWRAEEPEKAREELAPLLPVAHKAFKWSPDFTARGELAEALMKLKYEPAVPDVYARLKGAKETMEKQFLLSAIKRWPRADAKELVTRFVTDSNQQIQMSAKTALSKIEMAEKEAK